MIAAALRSTAARALLSAAILVWLATTIDMGAAARAVASISLPHLFLVLALVAVDRLVMIHRWVLLLRASGAAVATPVAARIFLISSFVGSFLPAGVGGDAARAYGLNRVTAQGSEALASVVVDRLLGVLSLVVMGIVGLLAWPPARGGDWRVVMLIAALTAAVAAAFWIDRLVRLAWPDNEAAGGLGRRLLRLADAISRYRGRGGVLGHVMIWSIAVQLLRITQAYFLGAGLGLAVPFTYYLLFMPVGLLMLLLPISISGFGVPQGVIVWLLRPMGVADEASFALSTLIVLTGLAGNLPGLVLWLRQDREIL